MMGWEPCQTQLQDLSAERAAMTLAHKAMLNGSCLILARNHMGWGLSMFKKKALSYKVFQRKALAFQKNQPTQPSSPGHLPLHTDQQKQLLSEFVFPPGSRKEEQQINLMIKLHHLLQARLSEKHLWGEPQCHRRP